MRWLAMSVAVHGALVVLWPSQPRRAASERVELDRSEDLASDAIDVAFVALPELTSAPEPPLPARSASPAASSVTGALPRGEGRERAKRAAAVTTSTTETSAPTAGGLLSMREAGDVPAVEGGGRRDVDLSADAAIARVANTGSGARAAAATPRSDAASDGLMVPNGNGTYLHERSTFKIEVARDGSVTIEDEPNLRAEIGLPCMSCLAEDFEKWRKTPYGGHVVNLAGLLPVLRGGFDLTDWMERLAGNDPYQYEKARFLDATRERRAEMSAVERRERERDALAKLPELLEAIWSYEPWSAMERRRLLFTLWDECDDTSAGRHARVTIEAFIRRRVPGYDADELAGLNEQRISAAKFAPYERPEPDEAP